VRVRVSRDARATLRLVRGRTTLTTRRFAVVRGDATLRYPLPKRLRPGWYRLRGSLVSADGGAAAFDRPFRLRR
jgi:hypothetical protein